MSTVKGQVTIFILVGVIILVLFATMFYITTSYTERETAAIEAQLSSSTIRLYVESCLTSSLQDGVEQLFAQGGYFYADQNGSVLDCSFSSCTGGAVSVDATFIPYILTANPDIERGLKNGSYPCDDAVMSGHPYCKFAYDPDRRCVYNEELRCPLPMFPAVSTLHLQSLDMFAAHLKQYVDDVMQECVDSGLAETELPVTVMEGTPNSSIIFGLAEMQALLRLPITVQAAGGEPRVVLQTYSAKLPLRIPAFHLFLKELLYKDATLPDFDILEYEMLNNYLEGFKVEKSVGRDDDDLIIVTDEQSLVNERPLRFQFIRENTAPILNYITNVDATTDLGHDLYWKLAGDPPYPLISIEPDAFDADEDTLTFSYTRGIAPKIALYEAFIDAYDVATGVSEIEPDLGHVGYWDLLNISVMDESLEDFQTLRILVEEAD